MGFTEIDTVTAAEETVPSDTVKVKLSEPLKLLAGVYVAVAPFSVAVPFAGCDAMEKVRASPSMSVPDSVMDSGTSSSVDTVCDVAVGASLSAATVIPTVAAGDVSVPSLTVKVKLSAPL